MKAENLSPVMSFEIQTLVFMLQYFASNLINTMHIAVLFVTIEYNILYHI